MTSQPNPYPADPQRGHPGARVAPPGPAGWAPPGGRGSEEATAVIPRRSAALPAGRQVPPTPPPWAFGGWPGPAYPPPTQRRSDRRKWAWIGGVTATVVAVIACTGLIAVASESDPTPARSAASPAPDSPSLSVAPSQAPPAPTVPLEALPRLLLDAGTVNGIEAATDIRVMPDAHADSPFSELSSDRPDCEGIQHPALTEALRGSGYLGVQTQFLRGDGHLVSQAVIDYPSAESATRFAAQQAENWGKCDGKPLTLTNPAEGSITFTVGTVTNRGGMLSVVFTQEGARGWGCQRALTARNNVVIDTRSCGFNRTDQATTAAARMADRVTTQ